MGIIRTRRDDGVEFGHALLAHGLNLLSPEEAAPTPVSQLTIERVRPEQSSASAYLRSSAIVLCGSCITNIGCLDCGPYLRLDARSSDADIGTAILSVLDAARTAAIPVDLKQEQLKLFRTVGVRSATQFNAGALCCSVWQTPDGLSITPSQNEGKHFSFLSKNVAVHVLGATKPEEIGKALKEGISRCT